MPIYEFNCAKCGKPTEVMQKLGERPPPCPHCGSKRMTRAVSKTSFALKGGGWYADLYSTPKPGDKKTEGGEAPAAPSDKAPSDKAAAKAGEPSKPGDSAKQGAGPKPAEAAKPGEGAKQATASKGEAAPRPASSPPGRRSPSPRKRR
jgi:putative FmdB family regulatory protein